LLNLDIRDERLLEKEARRREVKREIELLQAVRFGMHATQSSYEDRLTILTFKLRRLDEEE
jgi:UTP:GlnB (protein PII) uridylyltransferase